MLYSAFFLLFWVCDVALSRLSSTENIKSGKRRRENPGNFPLGTNLGDSKALVAGESITYIPPPPTPKNTVVRGLENGGSIKHRTEQWLPFTLAFFEAHYDMVTCVILSHIFFLQCRITRHANVLLLINALYNALISLMFHVAASPRKMPDV